jgi:putative transposase
MERGHVISEGEYYHLYNRGVEKRDIFLTQDDRNRFKRLLYLANGTERFIFRDIEDKELKEIGRGEPLVAIAAWVLMPNHFHILVREVVEGGTTTFMKKLCTGYSTYFNKRHGRVGPLFQGRYKSQHVESDTHLKYLFAYIHLNPVKLIDQTWKEQGIKNLTEAKRFLSAYEYSSYVSYLDGHREESTLLTKDAFPEYFLEEKDFEDFHTEWLNLKDENT